MSSSYISKRAHTETIFGSQWTVIFIKAHDSIPKSSSEGPKPWCLWTDRLLTIQRITYHRYGLLGIGWLHGGDGSRISLYGYHWSEGGRSLLCSVSAVETQDLPSGSGCQIRAQAVLVRCCKGEAGFRTLFCEGWSASGCVLERALKLGHLQWGRWWHEARRILDRGDIWEKRRNWDRLLGLAARSNTLATQAHHTAYQLMNQNYKILAIASFLEKLPLFLSDCVPRHYYE